jgi:hypothetical protein
MVKISELKDLTTKQLRDIIARAEEIVEARRKEETLSKAGQRSLRWQKRWVIRCPILLAKRAT